LDKHEIPYEWNPVVFVEHTGEAEDGYIRLHDLQYLQSDYWGYFKIVEVYKESDFDGS